MKIIAICGVAIITVILVLLLKSQSPGVASLLPSFSVIIITLSVLSALTPILSFVLELSENIGNGKDIIGILIKALGVALLTQIISDICKENGSSTLASTVEQAGNVAILLASVPLMRSLINEIAEILRQ